MSHRDRERPGSGVTLTDVAREAGVGESTVSRVLRRHGSFSDETRDRVLEVVARLGYVPNRIAGSLASTDSNLVALILPSLANVVFPDVLRGANAALASSGLQAVVGVTDYDVATEEALVGSLLAWRPRGLVVAGLEHSERARAMMRASGIRIAEVMDIDGEGIDIVVGFSNLEAGRISARFLIERGYRRIAYVGHDSDRDRRSAKRLEGFAGVLREAGLAVIDREIAPLPSSIQAGRDGLARLLARRPDLDAVYFSNDDMATGGYFHCLAEGIAIPGRLALFGFNGLEVGRVAPQPLSTVRTPRMKVGEVAVSMIVEDAAPAVVDVGMELIPGATA